MHTIIVHRAADEDIEEGAPVEVAALALVGVVLLDLYFRVVNAVINEVDII